MRIPLLRVLTEFINKIFACCRLQHLGSRQKNNVSVEFVITGKIDIKKVYFLRKLAKREYLRQKSVKL